MDAYDHANKSPDKLSNLYPEYVQSLKTFQCPSTNIEIATKEEIDEKAGYLYLGKGLDIKNVYPNTFMLIDRLENHTEGGNVGFADGAAKWMSGDKFQEILNQQK